MPDSLAVTGIDYWDKICAGARHESQLGIEGINFIRRLQKEVGVSVGMVSTGRDTRDVVFLPEAAKEQSFDAGDQIGFDFEASCGHSTSIEERNASSATGTHAGAASSGNYHATSERLQVIEPFP
jgi:hypothetical protein